MMAGEAEEFRYPTSHGVLKGVAEYAAHFLPAMHDLASIAPRMRETIEQIARAAPHRAGQRWLDYGAGGGVYAYHMGARFPDWTVTGWEGDYSSLRIAQELFTRPNVAFERRGFDAYKDLEPAAWDGITLLEVIEHVDDAGSILPCFYRGLRPGGLMVISTPNFMGWPNVRMETRRRLSHLLGRRDAEGYVDLINREPYDPATDSGHIATHSVWTLSTLMRKHGFTIVTFRLARLNGSLACRLFPDTLIVVARKDA